MEQQQVLLKDYTDIEKGAYLGAIASIATADQSASEEELEYIMALAESAELSEEQKQSVERAAKELSGEELKKCIDILKNSELRFSLITDLISFAKSDNNYTDDEKTNIEEIAQQLNINHQQYSLLDQFVKKTAEKEPTPEEISKPSFLSSLGLEDKFKNSGINIGSLGKSLLGIAGPMILAGLVSKGLRGRGGMGGGGGLNPFGNRGGGGLGGGGLGSLISSLSGGRGYSSSGGFLKRILGF